MKYGIVTVRRYLACGLMGQPERLTATNATRALDAYLRTRLSFTTGVATVQLLPVELAATVILSLGLTILLVGWRQSVRRRRRGNPWREGYGLDRQPWMEQRARAPRAPRERRP